MISKKNDLERHHKSQKHKTNVLKTHSIPLNKYFEKTTNKNEKVAEAEIKLANFFAQHNVAYSVVEHLVPLLHEIFPDSEIAKSLKLGRTKTIQIIKNVLAKKEITDLSEDFKHTLHEDFFLYVFLM